MIVKDLFAKLREEDIVNYVFEHPDGRYQLFHEERALGKDRIREFLRRMMRSNPTIQDDKVIIVTNEPDEDSKSKWRLLTRFYDKSEIARTFKEDADMEAAIGMDSALIDQVIDTMPIEQVKKLVRKEDVEEILYEYLPPKQELGFDIADTSIENFGALTVAGLILNNMMFSEYKRKIDWRLGLCADLDREEIFEYSFPEAGSGRLDRDDLKESVYRVSLKSFYGGYVELKRYVKECMENSSSEQD